MRKITKAVIPCAGFGTRFLPATKAIPKEMFPIIDTPSLQLIVQECVDSGITDILFIISEHKQCIKNHFQENFVLEKFLSQNNKQDIIDQLKPIHTMANYHFATQYIANGTGNAILLAKEFVNNEPFVVLYGDDLMYTGDKDPVSKQLIDAYEKTGKLIIGCQNVSKEAATKYGVVKPGETNGRFTEVKGFVEKPPIDKIPSTLVSLGRYVLTPDIFDIIEKTKESPNGEKYVTDAIEVIANTKGAYAYDFEARRYDIGDKNGFIEATIEYGLRNKNLRNRLISYLNSLDVEKIH